MENLLQEMLVIVCDMCGKFFRVTVIDVLVLKKGLSGCQLC